jgi:predicted NAD/FAD-dependent oxidoreductase
MTTTTYTLVIHTAHHWTNAHIEADTQEEAEAKAAALFKADPDQFDWQAYEFDATLDSIGTIDETD